MIASLPMYDRAETAAANDRFWGLIRKNLSSEYLFSPTDLTRTDNPWDHWLSNDLFLSQTCGYPYRSRLHDRVALVGTPVYDLDCEAGYYYSVLVAHKDDTRKDFNDFAGAKLAYNDPLSQSGWAGAQNFVAERGLEFGTTIKTGSHSASAIAVARRQADIAAIDALSWAMISKWDSVATDLKEIGQTPATPGLPYISAPGRDIADLRHAISFAVQELSISQQECLGIRGVTYIDPQHYLSIPSPAPPLP